MIKTYKLPKGVNYFKMPSTNGDIIFYDDNYTTRPFWIQCGVFFNPEMKTDNNTITCDELFLKSIQGQRCKHNGDFIWDVEEVINKNSFLEKHGDELYEQYLDGQLTLK